GGTAGTLEEVALAQTELAGLLDRHVDVVAAGQEALDPQEPVALVAQVQEAGDLDGLTVPVVVLRLACVLALTVAVTAPTATTTTVARLGLTLVLAALVLVLLVLLVLAALVAVLAALVLATLALTALTLSLGGTVAALALAALA